MSDISNQHVEQALEKIRVIFKKAELRIEAIPSGSKIPATQLAEEIAKEHGMTGPQLYPCLKFLFDNYPGVEVKRGAHGGICKIAPVALTPTVVAKVEAEVESILEDKEPAPIINT